MAEKIEVKRLEGLTVASFRCVVPSYSHVYQAFTELMGYLMEQKVVWTGSPLTLFHDMEYLKHDMDVEVAVPIAGNLAPTDKIKVRELPEIDRVACLAYKGPYENSRGAYKALIAWLTKNLYQLGAPNHEVYIFGPVQGVDSTKYITELQFPITGW